MNTKPSSFFAVILAVAMLMVSAVPTLARIIKRSSLRAAALFSIGIFGFTAGSAAAQGPQFFQFTGGVQTYVVPANATSITITAVGGAGGDTYLYSGGSGAAITGTFAVVPGEVLAVIVGGGGEISPPNSLSGGGGGGASFVFDATNTLLIAGGGGGALD